MPAATSTPPQPVKRQEFRIGQQLPALEVSRRDDPDAIHLQFKTRFDSDAAILHWGLARTPGGVWRCPPKATHPARSVIFDEQSVQSPFSIAKDGKAELHITILKPIHWGALEFVLYLPEEDRWIKNGRYDFSLELPKDRGNRPSLEDGIKDRIPEDAQQATIALDTGEQLIAAKWITETGYRLCLVSDADLPLTLHWGLARRIRDEWTCPPPHWRPDGSTEHDALAAHTPFTDQQGLAVLEWEIPPFDDGAGPRGINFVLYQPEEDLWIKQDGNDIHLSLYTTTQEMPFAEEDRRELIDQILSAEIGKRSWTLMHRFNLCHDLLDLTQHDPDALAILFVWLRYSAIRQLDWQRRYNTKPRDLSGAQKRLTHRLASLWTETPATRPWVRRILSTVGRGGEGGQGQQIRDEILNIMHRHKIKEQKGHFMEEWHQKLHNNTTPDDIVICEAYLAFLENDGDVNAFYQACEEQGVTRERLRGFDRPIVTDPVFYPEKKDGLIHDFQHYLHILHSVHGGADLKLALDHLRGRVDESIISATEQTLALGQESQEDRLQAATAAREATGAALQDCTSPELILDLLYLDLSLEETMRSIIESTSNSSLSDTQCQAWLECLLRSQQGTPDGEAFAPCLSHWRVICEQRSDTQDWALQARAVTDRIAAIVREHSTDLYDRLEPTAQYLGREFGADTWAVTLFSEEVIRGDLTFAISRLTRTLDERLRKQAGIGGWQIISSAAAFGRICPVRDLASVQETRYSEETVLVTERVSGEEEIPEGVTAVITADDPDLVSHVAVRARNMNVLFASCFDEEPLEALRALEGKTAALRVSPSGHVEFEEAELKHRDTSSHHPAIDTSAMQARPFSAWAIPASEFTRQSVGGKSNNLAPLRESLPEWIHCPPSMALPFGCFERVLDEPCNSDIQTTLNTLERSLDTQTGERLARMREAIHQLLPPDELRETLLSTWNATGLPETSWQDAWRAITRVWASKWNERAYLSRRHLRIPHASLQMAVLIQRVVESDYAFVIHTTNPLSGNPDELYAEVVLGMGETLVSNDPGRALGFTFHKTNETIELHAYPSKNTGLYGSGVIFRSDSNGEDLEGFAGAGLYDSVLAQAPERRILDYTHEPLFIDANARESILRDIARIGIETERICGTAQDIEGAREGDRWFVVQARPQVGLDPHAHR